MKKYILIALVFLVLVQSAHALSYDIVVARGDFPVDPLLAQVYTQTADIPLITVTKDGFTTSIKEELAGYREQGYKSALIIGGEAAVPVKVENELMELNYSVTRIWDWNRYGTAARVAVSLWESSDIVVVAQGDQSGALVSGARIAIDYESPLLLTETERLSDETSQAINSLGADRIILVGDVSESVRDELAGMGGLELTQFSQIQRKEPGGAGLFVIGIVIGALVIFLISSLWGAGVFVKVRGIPYSVLQEDEKRILDVVNSAGGEVEQQIIPSKTGFSRPKVSRVVSELESRGIIEKIKRGKTYSLKLIKELEK